MLTAYKRVYLFGTTIKSRVYSAQQTLKSLLFAFTVTNCVFGERVTVSQMVIDRHWRNFYVPALLISCVVPRAYLHVIAYGCPFKESPWHARTFIKNRYFSKRVKVRAFRYDHIIVQSGSLTKISPLLFSRFSLVLWNAESNVVVMRLPLIRGIVFTRCSLDFAL